MTPVAPTSLRFTRLLLTGAAGGLGHVLRPRLKACCDVLRVSDVAELGEAAVGEELRPVALQDRAAMLALLDTVSAVVHLGGVSTEHSFDDVLPANITGVYNLYEAVRLHGVRRVVFPSSNHFTGFYPQSQTIDASLPPRPDGYYGLSKAFGEKAQQLQVVDSQGPLTSWRQRLDAGELFRSGLNRTCGIIEVPFGIKCQATPAQRGSLDASPTV